MRCRERSFHLQTRLNPSDTNEMDVLPKGTMLGVKLLRGVDSSVDPDGSAYHGEVVDSVSAGSKVVVHSELEVNRILVLLRSKNHPEGFRYELLVTSLRDHEKTYDLTASLNPSFFETVAAAVPVSRIAAQKEPRTGDAGPVNASSSLNN